MSHKQSHGSKSTATDTVQRTITCEADDCDPDAVSGEDRIGVDGDALTAGYRHARAEGHAVVVEQRGRNIRINGVVRREEVTTDD